METAPDSLAWRMTGKEMTYLLTILEFYRGKELGSISKILNSVPKCWTYRDVDDWAFHKVKCCCLVYPGEKVPNYDQEKWQAQYVLVVGFFHYVVIQQWLSCVCVLRRWVVQKTNVDCCMNPLLALLNTTWSRGTPAVPMFQPLPYLCNDSS